MGLRQSEFKILNYLRQNPEKVSQRVLSSALSISLGKTNQLVSALTDQGYIDQYQLTSKGVAALEPYKVDNAIIMAAGMSSRFVPLSYEMPKGLLVVKGEVLIERQIRQLQEAGIRDITVVVGYMKEKYYYLEEQFGVRIVINEEYYRYNNPSSLIRVLDRLSNTYICSCDDYFTENVFELYVDRAYYSTVYVDGPTEEWCVRSDNKGRITGVTVGGHDSDVMLGHVYFDKAFSDRFKEILSGEYDQPSVREHLWEDLYVHHMDELTLYIRRYDDSVIKEFDSLNELRSFDKTYINNIDSSIFDHICKTLHCEPQDIDVIETIKSGLTNMSFVFEARGERYVYRHPGVGTSKYINRASEAASMEVAARLGLDDTFLYMDSDGGWKISRYIPNARELDYKNEHQVSVALNMIRTLHEANQVSAYDFDIWSRTQDLIQSIKEYNYSFNYDFVSLQESMTTLVDQVRADGCGIRCLCHNDCYSPNFLLDANDKMYLIDWEYSGNDDPASDLGTFICCSPYNYEEALNVLRNYLAQNVTDAVLRHYIAYVAIASYYWYVWALYKGIVGDPVGEWEYLWYRNTRLFLKKATALFNAGKEL